MTGRNGTVLELEIDPGAKAPELRWSAGDRAPVPDAVHAQADRLTVRTSWSTLVPALEGAARALAASGAERGREAARAAAFSSWAREDLPAPSWTAADLFRLIGSRPEGLSSEEAARRLEDAGENRLQRVRRNPAAIRLLGAFASFFAVLLWIGGGLALVSGMKELGLAIVVVILLNGVFSFWQEYRAERSLAAIEKLLPVTLSVVRDGREARRPALSIVPGDVVRIEEGDPIPADGQLISGEGLRLDQGSLTGEPHPVFKAPATERTSSRASALERPERVFAGTSVMSGSGTMIVTATGMATGIGRIARLTQGVRVAPSPLQMEMVRVTRVVTGLALGLGALFFALGVGTGRLGPHEAAFFALGIIVANVPEGLLPTLTLSLAMGVQRLARERSLIRRLSAVETLGEVQVICTDKTGTLTENRMRLRAAWTAEGEHDLAVHGRATTPALRALLTGAAFASVATRERGDPTERALIEAAFDAGVDVDAIRAASPVRVPHSFDSFRKRMTLVRQARDGTAGATTAWVKGAPRELLARCDGVVSAAGILPLTDAARTEVLAVHDRLASEGMRLLAVARRELNGTERDAATDQVERSLALIGLVALWDPPRPEVDVAIARCRTAGIHVVIATGDDGLTARALAGRIGLPVDRIVTGDQVAGLSTEALRDLALSPGVLFARVSPADKLAIVRAVRASGRVVAVTGDGVNDAPALKAADIGVAMGRRGSEVARESAEMVLTDDHFATIVSAVRLGRSIWSNVGRFVTYVFASNVPELVPFLAFALFGVPLPLTLMQVLAVDLGTDVFPALALGAEPPEPGVMERPPRSRGERLLDRRRLLHAYGFLGVIEGALAMFAFFGAAWLEGWRPGLALPASGAEYRRLTTVTFGGIVAAQIGNAFACRTDRDSVFRAGLLSNPLLLGAIAIEISVLLMLVYIPTLARIFGMEPPHPDQWLLLLAFPPIVLLAEETRKWRIRSRHAC